MSRFSQALLLAPFVVPALLVNLQAQTRSSSITVQPGVPLHIALDQRTSYSHTDRILEGHLTEPVYVRDVIAIPVGTKVLGRVIAVRPVAKQKEFDAILAGDFTPLKDPTVEFYSLVMDDGKQIPIESSALNRDSVTVKMNPPSEHEGLWKTLKSQAKTRISSEKKTVEDAVHDPHKWVRLKNAALDRLPYHPQVFNPGAKFVAELKAPVELSVPTGSAGHAEAETVAGAPGQLPPDSSALPGIILHARLVTDLSSAQNHWGDQVEAIVTEPVFGPKHELLFAEGTHLVGQVTHAEAAKRWARNGRLSFTFKQVESSVAGNFPMKGRLTAVEGDRSAGISLDEEGDSRASEPKAKHLVPLALVLASQAGLGSDDDRNKGGEDSNNTGVAFGGFGLTGRLLALSSGSRYIAYGIGYYGAARSIYTGFIARGKDVVFPRDTQVEIRLDPR